MEHHPEFPPMRTQVREILQSEDDLTEIVQLVGKDSLAESDKLILEVAKILREDYLQQNGFSSYDQQCPFYKTVWMMKNITDFFKLAQKAIENSTADNKITLHRLKTSMVQLISDICSMKFYEPDEGEEALRSKFEKLNADITKAFATLDD